MAGALTVDVIKAALLRIGAQMEQSSAELNELDGALGDGDLGVTMVRGMRAISSDVTELPDDLGLAFMKCAHGFTKTSGSTFGTLMATGLMAAAKVTKGQRERPWRDVSGLIGTALTAMASRGKAELGDKTVLDALESVRRAAAEHEEPGEMLAAAQAELCAALDRLRPQASRQGRARIFGEKTIGRDDPGMIAIQRLLESLA